MNLDDFKEQQFSTQRILRPNKWTWTWATLFACLVMALAVLWFGEYPENRAVIRSLFIALVFGSIIIFKALIRIVFNKHRLVIDETGFEVTRIFRHERFFWTEVSQIKAPRTSIFLFPDLTFSITNPHKDRKRKSLLGLRFETRLPDNYGMEPQQLAALMNQYRDAALARAEAENHAAKS